MEKTGLADEMDVRNKGSKKREVLTSTNILTGKEADGWVERFSLEFQIRYRVKMNK